MKKQTRLAMSGLVLAALLSLAACGGAGGGGQENGGDGMEGMDNGEMSGMENMEESTMGEMSGMEGMEETTGMSGMEDGSMDMGSMDMGSMLMEDGEYSDERFIDLMVPHHQGAVDMADVALQNAEHKEIGTLSREIISSQEAEIEELKDIKQREFGTSEVPMEMSGEEMEMMGMMMDPEELADAEPFDRAFIDNMIPHHQSAIDMAEVALENSENEEILSLAKEIISAQEREIEAMESWREEWYPQS